MAIDGSSSKCARLRADIEELTRDADLHPHRSKTTSPISWIGVAITAKQEKQKNTVINVLFIFGTRPEAIKLCPRSEEHTSELQSPCNLVCRLLLEKNTQQSGERRRQRQPTVHGTLPAGSCRS